MSAVWLCVIVVGLATIAVKAGGPVLAAGRDLPQGVGRVVDLLAPALLAALVATQAFASDEALVLDERAEGLLAGGAAILLRAPLLVVVLVAAVTAAGLPVHCRWSATVVRLGGRPVPSTVEVPCRSRPTS